ncbi:MAG: hypothetical protein HQ557_13230 [Bacteroidetes bacterium]|nr:hypothetical protein [Bacteroidota bacterium]
MNSKLLLLFVLFLLCVSLLFAGDGELEFALFKRTVSPVMKWGENGVLTIPKATTAGRLNAYVGIFGQQAGTINDLDLYLTSATVMVGSSADVELGYTRRQLIWEDFYFTDISMDTIHLKARVLDFGKDVMPSVAVGMNGVSLVDNTFDNENDILFNPYIAATSYISILPNMLEIDVTVVAETIMSDGEFGIPQFSLGVDANLLNMLYVFGEVQGVQIDLENFDLTQSMNEMMNIGAKLKLGWVSIGVGMFNIIRETEEGEGIVDNIAASTFNLENAQYMASVVVEVPVRTLLPSEN